MKDAKRPRDFDYVRFGFGAGLAIVLFWWISPVVVDLVLVARGDQGWDTRGVVGDTFGAVNALFSGLAFAGVLLALFMQREELRLQREELTATRKELQRAAAAQEKSELALAKQVEELATTRLSAVQPYIHVPRVTMPLMGVSNGSGMILHVALQNLGTGPAVAVTVSLAHSELSFEPSKRQSAIQVHGPGFPFVEVAVGPASNNSGLTSSHLGVTVEYRDLNGRWLRTTAEAYFEFDEGHIKGDLYVAHDFEEVSVTHTMRSAPAEEAE